MRGICEIQSCPTPNETKKIHEDFESLRYGVCWECGDKIKDSLENAMQGFNSIIEAIEKELT